MVVSGLSFMMYGSVWNLLNNFLHNPLTFYVDTAQYFGADRDPSLDSLIIDIAFYGGTCYSCEQCHLNAGSYSALVDCAALRNFTEIVRRHRVPCEELLTDCYWQKKSLDCCRFFRPLDTEFGRCFSVNAANVGIMSRVPPKLVSNRATGPGWLEFRVLEDVQLYLHDEFSIPHSYVDRSLRETVLWGTRKEIVVRVIEMENKDTVHELPIWRRNCRFPWETVNEAHQLYRYYSFSACSIECFWKTQLEICNCTHHLMPQTLTTTEYETQICSFEGLTCLTENSVDIARARKQCPCLSSCVEPEHFVVHKSDDFFAETEEDEGRVTVRLLSLPYERFVRNIAKTEMDLFMALGGLIGLFYGMSLLTTIDFLINIYLLTIRFFVSCHQRWLMG
uniref:Amiloride-sensitive sodium channel n=1 Tax=Anopheles funestus TaxID=62324 RepID=A0A182RPJ1_ANOFN